MKGPRHSSPCQTKGKEHPPVAPQGSAKPELPEPRATVDTEKKFSVPVPQALIFCSVWLSCSFRAFQQQQGGEGAELKPKLWHLNGVTSCLTPGDVGSYIT